MVKRFYIRLMILVVVVFFLQLLLGNFPVQFDAYPNLQRYLGSDPVEVLYIGDCINYSVSKYDKNRKPMTWMLEQMRPGLKMGAIAHGAYHTGIFASFCRYIVGSKHRPRVVIIPINLRSFSPQWDMMPHYQFEIETMILEGGIRKRLLVAFYKPLRAFGYNFFKVSREEYQATPVYFGRKVAGTVGDFNKREGAMYSEENIRRKVLFFYMFALTREHRKLKSLEEIVDLLVKKGVRPVFYITPIDYQGMERYYPGVFSQQLRENVEVIKEVLRGRDIEVLDLSMALGSDCFIWSEKGYPNEQLNEKGRRFIAEKLSRELDRF